MSEKIPLFKYLFKPLQYEYINQYFKRKDLKLSAALADLFTRYYQVVYSRKTCGHLSINALLTIGGYCEYPAIDISRIEKVTRRVKENQDIEFNVYFAEMDWLDHSMAKESIEKLDFQVNFKYLKNSVHQVSPDSGILIS